MSSNTSDSEIPKVPLEKNGDGENQSDTAESEASKVTPEKQSNDIPPVENPDPATQSEWTVRACLNLVGAFCVFFLSVGFINAYGVFQEYYAVNQLADKSNSSISWIGSFNVFCLFSGTLFTGPLQDKYGPRIMVLIGSILTVFAMFMVSLCKTYYQFFLAQGLLLGFGISFFFAPAIAILSIYFRVNRGLALGIAVSGSSLGGVIWPIALQQLFNEVSFGWTVRIAAFIMLFLSLVACLTIRPPITTGPKIRHKFDFSCAKLPVLQILAGSLFFVYLGLFSPFFYITPYSIEKGIDADLGFYMISIINAASLFGRLLPGFLADKFGRYNILILAAGTSSVILFTWTKATNLAGITVWSLAYGFTSGAVISIQGACAAAVVKPHQYGTAVGFVMGILSLAGLIGTPINGQLLTAGGYLALSMFSAASMMVGMVGLVFARLKLGRGLWDVI